MEVAVKQRKREFSSAALGTLANKVAKGNEFGTQNEVKKRQDNRITIYNLRFTAQAVLNEGRVCHCGKTPTEITAFIPNVGRVSTDVTPTIQRNQAGIYFSGLQSCGSVWVCPICSLKISQERRMEVFRVTASMLRKEGANAGHLVLTLRHDNTDSLKTVKDKLLKSWRKVMQQREYRDLCKQYKHLGDVRTLEVKVSRKSGWHPHLHILMFAQSSKEEMKIFANSLIDLYVRKNDRAEKKPQYYKEVYNEASIAEYITKWDISEELTMANMKIENGIEKDSYTPFALLKKIFLLDENRQQVWDWWKVAKFQEYAATMHGTRQMTFSKEVRKERLKLKIMSDEEIVKQAPEEPEECLAIDVPVWNQIAKMWLQPYVLNEYENGGVSGIQSFLMQYDVRTKYDPANNILLLDS